MKYVYHSPDGVKITGKIPRNALLKQIEARVGRGSGRSEELDTYALWLRHGLVPDAHVRLLMNVSKKQVM